MSMAVFYPWLQFLKLVAWGVLSGLLQQEGEPQLCKIVQYDGLVAVQSTGYIYQSYDEAVSQAEQDAVQFPLLQTIIECVPERELA